ncbi:MAG: hypothetical protein A2252_12350 [Elusimicrobia bacterium RIFOXYA2_FULL_39_19]|nr:MAG: hypothetical protein A2252_12350 [Elusimicrobia bacterium RIFOXYA2_FULL_39_19]
MKENIASLKEENERLKKLIHCLFILHGVDREETITNSMDMLSDTLRDMIKTMGLDAYCIMLLNSQDELSVKALYGMPDSIKDNQMLKLGEGISGQVAKTGKLAFIENLSGKNTFNDYGGAKVTVGSFLSVPLNSDEKVIGVLNVHNKKPNSIDKSYVTIIQDIAKHVSLSITNTKVYEKMKRISVKDDLTEMYNRRYIMKKIDEEIAKSKGRYPISVLMTEIKYLRSFNDSYGYLQGEQVLREVALILQSKVRTCDRVARYSGQRFIIFLPKTTKQRAVLIGDKFEEHVNAFLATKTKTQPESKLKLVVGVTSYPSDASSSMSLIKSVDSILKKESFR